jgi:hypothetical protein
MDPNNPNLYVYCANNPLKFIDPSGMKAVDEGYPWEYEDDDSDDDDYTDDLSEIPDRFHCKKSLKQAF